MPAAKTTVGPSGAIPAGGTPAGTGGIDQDIQSTANPATACEAGEAGNCEARIESYSTVTQGDPTPAWSAPTPTAIPPTPPAPQIAEPAASTGPIIEESGGATRTEAVGGGPTLADCMALWDKDVHMTKALWKTVCVRTMNGIDEPSEGLGIPITAPRNQTSAHAPAAATGDRDRTR